MNLDKILQEDFEAVYKDYDFSFLYTKSIFITGATGLLGSQLCKYLLFLNKKDTAQIKIFALARNLEKAQSVFKEQYKEPLLQFIKGDVLNIPQINEKIDFVIHGASITSSKDFINHAVETIDTAVNGTLNMLRFAKEKNVLGFVYLSSMEAFGITDGKGQVREKDLGYIDISLPRSSYMESKRMCENLCVCFASEYGLNVKSVRLTQTFGPGISYDDTRVAAYFSRCVIENKNIVLKTEGKTKRPILYTKDALTAILIVLKNGLKGETYTAANPETFVTIKETAQMIADKIAGGKIKVLLDIENPAEYAPNLNLNLNLNVEKLSSIGWKPSIGLEEAYRRMIEGMRV
jgi:UDP-glucuronate decarboxylase